MKLSKSEILKLVNQSLTNDPDLWIGDVRDRKIPFYIYNKSLGLYIWTANQRYGLTIGTIEESGPYISRKEELFKPNWWNRRKIYKKCMKITNPSKKIFEIPISKGYQRDFKLNNILDDK